MAMEGVWLSEAAERLGEMLKCGPLTEDQLREAVGDLLSVHVKAVLILKELLVKQCSVSELSQLGLDAPVSMPVPLLLPSSSYRMRLKAVQV